MKALRAWAKNLLSRHHADPFINRISGLIHIGASVGQEKDLYAHKNLKVAWVEPIPAVFASLQQAIVRYPGQRAFNYLVTDQDDREVPFHISNNSDSSSIFELSSHKEIWPEVAFVDTMMMKTITLPTLVAREHLDLDLYQALVLDTQGSELLVLKGASSILRRFEFIKSEVADFESYVGCVQLPELNSYLLTQGFSLMTKRPFAKSAVGTYYDVVYHRRIS
jgi:FkbM family methyltransferase